jgi:hypothetical protein
METTALRTLSLTLVDRGGGLWVRHRVLTAAAAGSA